MDLQKKLDLIENYRTILKTHRTGKGIEYTIVSAEVKHHGREERTKR